MSSAARKRRKAGPRPVPEGRRYEAFGRVMGALATEAELMEACRDLTWWQGPDHGWNIEWRDGPYASEISEALLGQIRQFARASGPPTPMAAALRVMGVSFELRAIDPLGQSTGVRPGLWRMAEALDTSRHTSPHEHWEELLGG